jgi:hypothetical protein
MDTLVGKTATVVSIPLGKQKAGRTSVSTRGSSDEMNIISGVTE